MFKEDKEGYVKDDNYLTHLYKGITSLQTYLNENDKKRIL
jgi:hypothetical protein